MHIQYIYTHVCVFGALSWLILLLITLHLEGQHALSQRVRRAWETRAQVVKSNPPSIFWDSEVAYLWIQCQACHLQSKIYGTMWHPSSVRPTQYSLHFACQEAIGIWQCQHWSRDGSFLRIFRARRNNIKQSRESVLCEQFWSQCGTLEQ